jgi:undecaprenyl-diphosphatase
MDLMQTLVLALLQGLTEFLPISSSAHLILLPKLLGWPDQGLTFDVAVHVGTLAAVLWYFRVDIKQLVLAWFADVFTGVRNQHSRLAWAVIAGSVPIMLVGLIVYLCFADELRNPLLISITTLVFGLVLWWADRAGARIADEYSLTIGQALLIGCAQILALIPGVSRSGITITAGLALGLTRKASARFSFLLSIPVILSAGGISFIGLLNSPEPVSWSLVGAGTVTAAVTAYLCISYFLALIERIGLTPFVVYRVTLAVFLFYIFF